MYLIEIILEIGCNEFTASFAENTKCSRLVAMLKCF